MAEPKIRVLVVEDDENVRLVVQLRLRQLNFEVETAADGEEALLMLDVDNFDVILLDLRMPEMDGYEFMQRYNGKTPIVVMSGWADADDLPREVFAKVTKPMSM